MMMTQMMLCEPAKKYFLVKTTLRRVLTVDYLYLYPVPSTVDYNVVQAKAPSNNFKVRGSRKDLFGEQYAHANERYEHKRTRKINHD